MPPRVHRASFVPKPIGLARVAVDQQGRIVIPAGIRTAFLNRRPPIEVFYSLAGPGYVTMHSADTWPPKGERTQVGRVLSQLERLDAEGLPSDHLKVVQELSRVVACRYLDGRIAAKWQVTLPEPVRAWLGLRVEGAVRQAKPRKRKSPRGALIILGNVASFEIWSEAGFQYASIKEQERFANLLSEAEQALAHATK